MCSAYPHSTLDPCGRKLKPAAETRWVVISIARRRLVEIAEEVVHAAFRAPGEPLLPLRDLILHACPRPELIHVRPAGLQGWMTKARRVAHRRQITLDACLTEAPWAR